MALLVDLEALGLAWARFAPTLAIVPAFGLKALPVPARGILGVALAAGIYPAIAPIAELRSEPWVVLALEQILLGLPVALAAAIPLWAATMAGGLVDSLRGAQDGAGLAVVEGGKTTPIAILLSLLASIVFLSTGGPARVATALTTASFGAHPLLDAAQAIVAGIGIAIAVGAPLLAAAVVLEIAFALVARAASPSQVHALLAPLRALGLLAVIALVLDRITSVLALAVHASPT
ncbi:MAG: flagellar biosynthetic protein FliR [Labilithrix sp.]|nr:flagellar biosynthetic protein FliR [Labilithrix sp.]MCW5811914.1 flagellar biosynthetic protein FliR [Labilithrix sp.]